MKILNIMIGLPGCGKSTFCEKELTEWNDGEWVSRDAIRFAILKEGESYFSHETVVFNSFISTIKKLMEKDEYNIFIDATHINSAARHKVLNRLNLKGDEEICYYFFDTPIEECMRRNRTREGLRRVPDTAIRDMKARAQFYITDAERRAYHPVEYHVNWEGELQE